MVRALLILASLTASTVALAQDAAGDGVPASSVLMPEVSVIIMDGVTLHGGALTGKELILPAKEFTGEARATSIHALLRRSAPLVAPHQAR